MRPLLHYLRMELELLEALKLKIDFQTGALNYQNQNYFLLTRYYHGTPPDLGTCYKTKHLYLLILELNLLIIIKLKFS